MTIQQGIKIIFLFIIVLIITLVLLPTKILAQTILFSDDFESGNTSNWIVIGDPGWNIQSGKYGIHLEPGVSNSVPSDEKWNSNWEDLIFKVDLIGISGTDKNLIFRFIDDSNFYSIHHTGDYIYFEKFINNNGYQLAPRIYYPLENNIEYYFKVEINGDRLKVFENNNLLFNIEDNTEPKWHNGKIGLRVGTGGVSPTEVWFDNIVVEELFTSTPTPTPISTMTPIPTPIPTPFPTLTPNPTPTSTPLSNLNVEDIKQFSLPWKNEIYDQATKWSQNPTIERWGCALTSATMILRYYGHNVWPNTLNNWLKTQSDGYIRNGLLNWLAVSRYTFLNKSSVALVLEYRRLPANLDTLINELRAGYPAILKVPNHFVVVKSQLSSTFGINDPAFTSRTTLASYGDLFETFNSYHPSFTDLSYILLIVDSNINLKIFNTANQEIDGYFFNESPLKDDLDGNLSGNNLNIFLYPTPQIGNYKIEVSGPSTLYTLDSYLYDQKGDVNQLSQKSIILEGQKDNFQIFYGDGINTIKEDITFNSILKDLEGAFKLGKIKNKYFYNSLKFEILTAKNFVEKKKIFFAKRTLNNILFQLKFSSPFFLDKTVSQIIQKDIKELLKSLL